MRIKIASALLVALLVIPAQPSHVRTGSKNRESKREGNEESKSGEDVSDLNLRHLQSNGNGNSDVRGPSSGSVSIAEGCDEVPGNYLVRFSDDDNQFEGRLLGLMNMLGRGPQHIMRTVMKAAAFTDVTPNELKVIQTVPGIVSIEHDCYVSIDTHNKVIVEEASHSRHLQSTQSTPWGIARVGGAPNYLGSSTAWVIDTGIDFTHPDLNVDIPRSRNFVNASNNATDDHGHGTQ